jgi:hypothetical protein
MTIDERDIFWFRRRGFVQAAAAFGAAGLWLPAHAQSRSNIVHIEGEVLLNRQPLARDGIVQTGDVVQTGQNSRITFVIGDSSMHLRQNTLLKVERGDSLSAVAVLRLVTGALATVFRKGREERRVLTPTATAGIRGTGFYLESEPARTYFCNCYGEIELAGGSARVVSRTDYHDSFWISPYQQRNGSNIWPSPPRNHTDEELETLARLLAVRTAWEDLSADERRRRMAEKPGYAPAPAPAAPRP